LNFLKDTDSHEDMTWIFDRATERAAEFGIKGVTFKLTQGVVKVLFTFILCRLKIE